jgi:hypothetical protein
MVFKPETEGGIGIEENRGTGKSRERNKQKGRNNK